ncbi:hypothetical protein GZH47_13090 [Paenibacillus rhizovicinus]|uniref:Uncharacterized protein n=1 Tax=Paenibacillus rhizovicinus TaxID=2704463 RepID=A0A6C0NZM8_9BACL|nr:hypothetical protein [Paenibacillus rhizovicinus]QHW31684.1 hypothetical protein GZH47_13090 [Paenibacillus rhizovicinus]
MDAESRTDLERILGRLRQPELVRLLTEELSGSDFNTLLLEVFRERIEGSSAADLLKRYTENRFVHPAHVDPIALKQLELELLHIAVRHHVAPVQLSPVAPLGSASVMGKVDQNKVISASRGTEVVPDATNLLALHVCDTLRKGGEPHKRSGLLRYCTTHRHVRAQNFGKAPGMLPHFHLFGMVTSGLDTGSYGFEKQAFWEHVEVYRTIFREAFDSEIELILSARSGYRDAEGLVARLVAYGEECCNDLKVTVGPASPGNLYYAGMQFTIKTTIRGKDYAIGDGGFVDWTQQLLGSKKERLLISAIGMDRLLDA